MVISSLFYYFSTKNVNSAYYLPKEDIIKVVRDNQELLSKVPYEIKSFKNQYTHLIEITKKRSIIKSNDVDINFDRSNYINIKNNVLSDVLNIKCIIEIDSPILENERLYIHFYCTGKGIGSLSDNAIYYTDDNLPIGWLGSEFDFTQSGNGWIYEESGFIYYTERIIDNWFYYEKRWNFNQ